MSMIAAKPPGYFGRTVDEHKLARFQRYGLPLDPEAPAAFVDWSVFGLDGAVRVTFGTLPDARDAIHYGDGAGVLLDVVVVLSDALVGLSLTPVSLGIAPGSYEIDVPPEFSGVDLEVTIRAIGSAGPGEPATLPVSVGVSSIWPTVGIWPTSGLWPA